MKKQEVEICFYFQIFFLNNNNKISINDRDINKKKYTKYVIINKRSQITEFEMKKKIIENVITNRNQRVIINYNIYMYKNKVEAQMKM